MDDRIIKYFENTLPAEERSSLLQEIKHNKELKKEFYQYKNILALTSFTEKNTDTSEGKLNYQSFINDKKIKQRKKAFLKISSYAATVAIIILGTVFTTNKINTYPLSAEINTLYAPAGQRAVITLSDGTKVWLNANSTITYPAHFSKDERLVTLEGEAYFDVAKSEESMFIVSSKDFKTKVLGTKFYISSYPNAKTTSISLIDGSVEVLTNNTSNKLAKNEQLQYTDGIASISKIDTFGEFMWIDGIYSFESKPLKEIVKKLELYYDITIVIENKKLENLVYTGKFRQRDGVMEILKVLQKLQPFSITKDEQRNLITLK